MPAAPPAGTAGWGVVLPVKGGPSAKSRLGRLAARELALAVALDALAAVRACPRVGDVVVVTADPAVAAAVAGARVVADPGGGLDAAAAAGLAALDAGGPRAVLLADVPCLRPQDLAAALDAAAGRGAAFVPDAEGTGTVLLAQAPGPARRSRFGPGSAAAHAGDGAARLELALPRLRCDVDTPADLAQALALGVGPATAAALASAGGAERPGA